MTYYIGNSWQVGTQAFETFNGDRYGVARNDTFQLSGSETGSLSGIRNGWQKFNGGEGYDRIYVAPNYKYIWTAVMISDDGLKVLKVLNSIVSPHGEPSLSIFPAQWIFRV